MTKKEVLDLVVGAVRGRLVGIEDLKGDMRAKVEAKLNAAQSDLAAGSVASALQDLADLIAESRAQSGKHIPTAQASSIISQTQATIDTIGILYG